MYVVRTGEVTVEHGGRVIETLGGGGIFGEMALIDKSVRSGTVRAKSDCEVAPINEKTFLFPGPRDAVLRNCRDARLPGGCGT
jgi:CRP/FNR family cyclic AMP-dependent transcriptional regulator